MRRARFTFQGAFHHVMNRGHNKNIIFPSNQDKNFFINLIKTKSKLLKIRILTYVIMDNHYHIILQNSSNKLSEFMKQINGIYGTYFRKKYGGCGYVFANRFKSTLIQDNKYLLIAILYTLKNPLRAKIVSDIYNYEYSSINEYFNQNLKIHITDHKFVEDLFQTKNNLITNLNKEIKIKEKNCRMGKVMGNNNFIKNSIKKFNRRKYTRKDREKQRIDERPFDKYKDIIKKFERKENITLKNLNIHSLTGKRIRRKLLKSLREKGGFTYKQINRLTLYRNLKLNSLSILYLNA